MKRIWDLKRHQRSAISTNSFTGNHFDEKKGGKGQSNLQVFEIVMYV